MNDGAYSCPACSSFLVPRSSGKGQVWVCGSCAGCLIGISLLREGVDAKAVGRFWSQARVLPHSRVCPACRRSFATATVPDGPELDACRTCYLVWCDGGELERLPRRNPAVDPPSRLRSPPAAAPGEVQKEADNLALTLDAASIVLEVLASWS